MLPKKVCFTPSIHLRFMDKDFAFLPGARYDVNKVFMFLVKFGQTIYEDRENIGSGNDLIQGNKKADLQMQLRIKI